MPDIHEIMAAASARWGIHPRQKTRSEAASSCPWCGGADRFIIFADGGYWCRQCKRAGRITEKAVDEPWEQSVEQRLRALEQSARNHEARISRLEIMAQQMAVALKYFENCLKNDAALEWWSQQGIRLQEIEKWALGYCPRCPTDQHGRSSYTIPIVNGGQLRNIRHRLAGANNGDKYRPHMAGLPPTLFNADAIGMPGEHLLIVEGEKKAIVLDRHGFTKTIGIMGKSSWQPGWAKYICPEKNPQILIALDPDATAEADILAAQFGPRGRVVELPVKADDFFTIYGGTAAQFREFLRLARRPRSTARSEKHK